MLACLTLALLVDGAQRALADGGTVQCVERHGDYQISVFTAPTPLRAGPIDISVLLQQATSGQPVSAARTEIMLTQNDRPGESIHAIATTEAATNKLLQSALIELPASGRWNVRVTSTFADQDIAARFSMTAGPPQPRWLSEWLWFTWPVVAVLLFAVHRRLVTGKQRSGEFDVATRRVTSRRARAR